jgi:putative flippase GtrA
VNLGRIVRFGIVGVVNTGTYFAIYLLLRQWIPYLVAHVCAFTLAMVGSYFLNCYFTFRTPPSIRSFLLFPMSNLANFVITTVGLYVLVQHFGMDQRLAAIPAAAIAIPITFLVAQFTITGHRRGSGPATAPSGSTRPNSEQLT